MPRPSPGPATARSSRAAVPAALGALVLVALLLRVPLMDDAFFADELSTYYVVRDHGLGEVVDFVRSAQEQTPPLYFVLAWAADQLGHDSWLMRLPSLLAGLALIPLVYLLGRRTVGRAAGLLGAVLATFAPFLVFYATEARSYGVALLLATLSTLALVTALQTRSRRWWVVYALASCLAMYTHYTTVFVLFAQAAWALVACRAQWKPLVLANAGAALAFAPWLPEYRADDRTPVAAVIEKIHPFTLDNVTSDLKQLFSGVPFEPPAELPGRLVMLMLLVGALVAVGGVALRVRRERTLAPGLVRWGGLLLACALAVPVLAAVVSVVGTSIFLTRNLITALPAALLLLAALALLAPGRWRLGAVGLLVGGYVAGGVQLLDAEHQRPDAEAAVAWAAARAEPGDPIVQTTVTLNGPGVLQPVEIALHDRREDDLPVVRFGAPPEKEDRARREPPLEAPGQFFPLEAAPAADVAREALALARAGRIFMVAPGVSAERLQSFPSTNELSRFLAALGDGWEVAAERTYPGFAPTAILELRGPAAG